MQLMTESAIDVHDGDSAIIAVIEAAIAAFRGHPIHEVGYDLVVEMSGVEPAAVQAVFPGWDDVLIAVVETWNHRQLQPVTSVAEEHGAVALLRAMLLANLADPARVRLMAAMVPLAATPEHPLAGFLQQEWVRFHALVQRTLIRDVELGIEPSTVDCARGAEQLIALYEGLQIQSMVRPGMRLLPAYDRAVVRLQDGWKIAWDAPVWKV